MEFRNLGSSGLRVSKVGLGCNGFTDPIAAGAVFGAALDQGVNFFDTADLYGLPGGGSEKIIGTVMEGRRGEVVIATKCGFLPDGTMKRMGASRRYIMSCAEASLKRLKTDYIDLYQIHSPDPLTPIEETLRALEDLIRQGKVLYAGSSNYGGWQVMEAFWTGRTLGLSGFISGQCEYSLLSRGIETEVIPAMLKCGFGLLPYFPLASGLLTGKYQRGVGPPADSRLGRGGYGQKFLTDRNFAKVEALEDFARRCGHSLLDLAMSWLSAQPAISSIISGASSADQVRANVAAASWTLSPEQLNQVDQLTRD